MLGNLLEKLSKNEILTSVLITIIAGHITKISDSLTENIILPIIDFDIDGDGSPDGRRLINYEMEIMGTTFKLGKFVTSLVEFILVLYLVNLLSDFVDKKNKV